MKISLQYKWGCKHKIELSFRKFYLMIRGIAALQNDNFLQFKLSFSFKISDIKKQFSDFNLSHCPLLKGLKMLEFTKYLILN